MEILKTKEKVYQLLLRYPQYRDSDNKLLAQIWFDEIGKSRELDAYSFLKMLANNELSSLESVTRCRRMLQEDFSNLRGEKWNERHQQQTNVKKDLGYQS